MFRTAVIAAVLLLAACARAENPVGERVQVNGMQLARPRACGAALIPEQALTAAREARGSPSPRSDIPVR